MLHGADYNYEQWLDEPDILADDFRLMQETRCNVMSVVNVGTHRGSLPV
jgi:beta-galactosidase